MNSIYTINFTTKAKKDFKLCQKRNYDISLLKQIFVYLSETGTVPEQYKPHKLTGNYSDCIECHIKPDWLLIWQFEPNTNILNIVRLGTHSDLF